MTPNERAGHTRSTRDRVFDFLVRHKRAHDGNSPTTREIAQACDIALSVVHYHLTRLEIANLIHITGKPRANIEIVGGVWRPPTDSADTHAGEAGQDRQDGSAARDSLPPAVRRAG